MSDSLLLTVKQSTVRVQIAPTVLLTVDSLTPIQLPIKTLFSYRNQQEHLKGLFILWGPPNPHNPSHLAHVMLLCVSFYFAFVPVSLLIWALVAKALI